MEMQQRVISLLQLMELQDTGITVKLEAMPQKHGAVEQRQIITTQLLVEFTKTEIINGT